MIEFINLVVNGIMNGAIYSLIAVSIVIIVKASGVFNFAQGEFLLIGAYVFGAFLVQIGCPLWASFLITLFISALLGLAIERLTLRPLIGQPMLSLILMTMVLSTLLLGIVTLIWGAKWIVYPKIVGAEMFSLWGIKVSSKIFMGFILVLIVLLVFSIFFQYTKTGLAMRATSEDHQLALSMGISVKRIFALVWVLAAMFSSIAGVILASLMGAQTLMVVIGLKAFPVVLLGGLESVLGAIIAGPIIGILENLASGYLDPLMSGEMKEVVPFIVVLLVLLVKPYGLFGLVRIERI